MTVKKTTKEPDPTTTREAPAPQDTTKRNPTKRKGKAPSKKAPDSAANQPDSKATFSDADGAAALVAELEGQLDDDPGDDYEATHIIPLSPPIIATAKSFRNKKGTGKICVAVADLQVKFGSARLSFDLRALLPPDENEKGASQRLFGGMVLIDYEHNRLVVHCHPRGLQAELDRIAKHEDLARAVLDQLAQHLRHKREWQQRVKVEYENFDAALATSESPSEMALLQDEYVAVAVPNQPRLPTLMLYLPIHIETDRDWSVVAPGDLGRWTGLALALCKSEDPEFPIPAYAAALRDGQLRLTLDGAVAIVECLTRR